MTLARGRSNFENFVRGGRFFLYIYIYWTVESLVWRRLCGVAFQTVRILRGGFAENTSHISDFNPYTPHKLVDYIPTPVLPWPFVLDIAPCIPLLRIHTVVTKLLGCRPGAGNTKDKECMYRSRRKILRPRNVNSSRVQWPSNSIKHSLFFFQNMTVA